jgi:hypothetical protein
MGISEIVAIFFGIIGIIGIVYTVYYGKKALKKKLLVYQNSVAIPLAQAFSPEADYKLSVLFQRKGSGEERIKSVYTTFLKFANLGKESIRGNDIAPTNPIKINIEGARTLDIQIAGITREVNNMSLRNQVMEQERASAEVYFDFLDNKDGALIKVLTVGNKGKISLSGDIIGMPEGIKNIEDASGSSLEGTSISGWAAAIAMIIAFSLMVLIFYWVIGSWTKVWLIVVPFIVLILVIAGSVIIHSLFVTRRRPSFPKSLDLPKWCRSFLVYPRGIMREQLSEMRLEEETSKTKET